MNYYADTPFEPCLHYERDFDLEKKAPMHTMSVEFGKMAEIEDKSDDDDNPTMASGYYRRRKQSESFKKRVWRNYYTQWMNSLPRQEILIWILSKCGKNGQRFNRTDQDKFGID